MLSGVGPVDQTEFAAASEFDANVSVADDEFPSMEEAAMLSRGIRTSVTKNATGLIKLFEFILTIIKQHYQGYNLPAGNSYTQLCWRHTLKNLVQKLVPVILYHKLARVSVNLIQVFSGTSLLHRIEHSSIPSKKLSSM